MAKFVALCAEGLEKYAADELSKSINLDSPADIKKGMVFFELGSGFDKLLCMKQADDILILVRHFTGIKRYRYSLNKIRKQTSSTELSGSIKIICVARKVDSVGSFSVDADYSGRRDYKEQEIEEAVSESILSNTKLVQKKEGIGDMHFSVILRPEISLLGLSLADMPLHIKNKIQTVPGSVRSSVAFTMLGIAGVKENDLVLDPMCGSGIIAINAASLGAKAIAGDIDSSRIDIAKINAGDRHAHVDFHVWDARDTSLGEASVDKVICNLPFGKQAGITDAEDIFFGSLLKEMLRITRPKSDFVFLTKHPEILSGLAKGSGMVAKDNIKIVNSGLESFIVHFARK